MHGNEGRLRYQQRRCEATDKTILKGGYHDGCFHDHECRLAVVDDTHNELEQRGDDTLRGISHLTLDYMLQADHDQRWTAEELLEAWMGFQHQRLVEASRPPSLVTSRSDPPRSLRQISAGYTPERNLLPMTRHSYTSSTISDGSAPIYSRYSQGSPRDAHGDRFTRPQNTSIREQASSSGIYSDFGGYAASQSHTYLDDLTSGTALPAYPDPHLAASFLRGDHRIVNEPGEIEDKELAKDTQHETIHDGRLPSSILQPTPTHGQTPTVVVPNNDVDSGRGTHGFSSSSRPISPRAESRVTIQSPTFPGSITVDILYKKLQRKDKSYVKRKLGNDTFKDLIDDYPSLDVALNMVKGIGGREQVRSFPAGTFTGPVHAFPSGCLCSYQVRYLSSTTRRPWPSTDRIWPKPFGAWHTSSKGRVWTANLSCTTHAPASHHLSKRRIPHN